MSDKDLDEFFEKSGQLADFTPRVEEMFFSFMGYLTTRPDFMVGQYQDPTEVLNHYGVWRKKVWPYAKASYARDRDVHEREELEIQKHGQLPEEEITRK